MSVLADAESILGQAVGDVQTGITSLVAAVAGAGSEYSGQWLVNKLGLAGKRGLGDTGMTFVVRVAVSSLWYGAAATLFRETSGNVLFTFIYFASNPSLIGDARRFGAQIVHTSSTGLTWASTPMTPGERGLSPGERGLQGRPIGMEQPLTSLTSPVNGSPFMQPPSYAPGPSSDPFAPGPYMSPNYGSGPYMSPHVGSGPVMGGGGYAPGVSCSTC